MKYLALDNQLADNRSKYCSHEVPGARKHSSQPPVLNLSRINLFHLPPLYLININLILSAHLSK
jgi:hypothetical protein